MKEHTPPNWMPFSSYAVALYDMDVKDVRKRFENRIEFPKAVMAANFLGIVPGRFYECLRPNRYVYHRETGKKYAARKIIK